MVAMTPLITIQLLGVEYKIRKKREEKARSLIQDYIRDYADDDIIEL